MLAWPHVLWHVQFCTQTAAADFCCPTVCLPHCNRRTARSTGGGADGCRRCRGHEISFWNVASSAETSLVTDVTRCKDEWSLTTTATPHHGLNKTGHVSTIFLTDFFRGTSTFCGTELTSDTALLSGVCPPPSFPHHWLDVTGYVSTILHTALLRVTTTYGGRDLPAVSVSCC